MLIGVYAITGIVWAYAMFALRRRCKRTDDTLLMAADILKRHQEEIRALQRHAAAMEQGAVDERTALIWLSQRLSDRGVIDASDMPADSVETTH